MLFPESEAPARREAGGHLRTAGNESLRVELKRRFVDETYDQFGNCTRRKEWSEEIDITCGEPPKKKSTVGWKNLLDTLLDVAGLAKKIAKLTGYL